MRPIDQCNANYWSGLQNVIIAACNGSNEVKRSLLTFFFFRKRLADYYISMFNGVLGMILVLFAARVLKQKS